MRAPGHVGEGLVDGDPLDVRREVAQDGDGGVAKPLILVEMPADEEEVGTELPRAPSWHAASHAEGPCFVGGREDDAASDRNRLTAQARLEQLLDGRIEGVEVRVKHGRGGDRLAALFRHRRNNGERQPLPQVPRHLDPVRGGRVPGPVGMILNERRSAGSRTGSRGTQFSSLIRMFE